MRRPVAKGLQQQIDAIIQRKVALFPVSTEETGTICFCLSVLHANLDMLKAEVNGWLLYRGAYLSRSHAILPTLTNLLVVPAIKWFNCYVDN